MKIIFLVESNEDSFEKMIASISDRQPLLIDTGHCDEENEYRYLFDIIAEFSKSEKEVMLVRFSGKESIPSNLGGECSEMIVTLSDKQKSNYYTKDPETVFSDLISIFA